MKMLSIDHKYLVKTLAELVSIPSPSGYTDQVVHYVCKHLKTMKIDFELTRRGAIRANLPGKQASPDRAIVAHLDTLGAMTRTLKSNGRLAISPIGFWSSRFAEGARVTIFTDKGPKRGTVLPLKASGHTYNMEIDTQPVDWNYVEVRVDEKSDSLEQLKSLGHAVGDFIAVDPSFEYGENGFINSRHLDNKAGVATLLASVKALLESKAELPMDCHLLFTISEEVGSGASAVLHGDVSEMLSIDNSTVAPDQNSNEYGVTIAIKDSSGPFDYHLTQKILRLCRDHNITHSRDVFRWYRCDAASAIEAGNDIRTSLICFACDASHGYERTHIESLDALGRLLGLYIQSPPTFERDVKTLGPIADFPSQPIVTAPEKDPKGGIKPESYDKD